MDIDESALTFSNVKDLYLQGVREARSENTTRAYSNAMASFMRVLSESNISQNTLASEIQEDWISIFLTHLKSYSSATERLYVQAIKGFFIYLAGENIAEINIPRIDLLIKRRSRIQPVRLPQFPRDDIEKILEYVKDFTNYPVENQRERLRALRDRAFLITLADTGLRVHEACGLNRGDMDWNEGHAIIIGKGNKQSIVRFSRRSLQALRDYLQTRATLDGKSGRPMTALPLFSRHDRGAGRKIKRISTTTGRNIVNEWVRQVLGQSVEGKITPHSFRHYFVTTVLRGSGNIKLAQELARHASIQVTQRYAHLSNDELDKGYHEIFEKE